MEKMEQGPRILLLSAPIGAGHVLAAKALEEELKERGLTVIHENIFGFFPGFLGKGFMKIYLGILKLCPWLYKAAYKWGNREGGSLWLRGLLNRLLLALGRGFLEKVRPDAVLTTHATPTGLMALYKKQHPEVFLGAVVTDFMVHQWWLCPGVDAYFLAHPLLRDRLPKEAACRAYGLPLRQAFNSLNREAARQALGWQQQVVLILGGGEGLLPMEAIIGQLINENLRLVAITGRNERLAQALKEQYGERATIWGYRDDLPQLLVAADIVISKAGALTCAEVLACGSKFIIFQPLPGQEQGNSEFLQKQEGVLVAASLKELKEQVRQLLSRPTGKAKGSEAAKKICDYVLSQERMLKLLDQQRVAHYNGR